MCIYIHIKWTQICFFLISCINKIQRIIFNVHMYVYKYALYTYCDHITHTSIYIYTYIYSHRYSEHICYSKKGLMFTMISNIHPQYIYKYIYIYIYMKVKFNEHNMFWTNLIRFLDGTNVLLYWPRRRGPGWFADESLVGGQNLPVKNRPLLGLPSWADFLVYISQSNKMSAQLPQNMTPSNWWLIGFFSYTCLP